MRDSRHGEAGKEAKAKPLRKSSPPIVVRIFRALKRLQNRYRRKRETDHRRNERLLALWTRRLGLYTALLVVAAVASNILFYCSIQDARTVARQQAADTQAALAIAKSAGDAAQRNADAAISAAQTAKDTLIDSERAFVTQTGAFAIKPMVDPSTKTLEWFVAPPWTNSGNTPTVNLRLYIDCASGDASMRSPLDFVTMPTRYQVNAALLGPHNTQYGGSCPTPWSAERLAGMKAIMQFLYVGGIAIYNDIFGASHRTEFCEAINFSGDPSVASDNPLFVESRCTSHNCADQECTDK